jgi:hypothetical protein
MGIELADGDLAEPVQHRGQAAQVHIVMPVRDHDFAQGGAVCFAHRPPPGNMVNGMLAGRHAMKFTSGNARPMLEVSSCIV